MVSQTAIGVSASSRDVFRHDTTAASANRLRAEARALAATGNPAGAASVFGDRFDLPKKAVAVVAVVDGRPVSGGRVDFEDGVEFAGLFGGVTLPEYRGRGLYRATVAKRAELARERGYHWLYSDALPTSRPILERLGFVAITTTTPWTFGRHPDA